MAGGARSDTAATTTTTIRLLRTARGAGPPCRIELNAIRSDRFDPERRRTSVLHRVTGNGEFGSGFEIAWTYAISNERRRALRFEAPRRHGTVLVGDVNEQPRMRIGELELLYDAVEY